jgi:CRP-like cAMP-binding protein
MVALETQKKTGLSASGPGSSMQTNCDPLIRKLESIGELSDEDRQAIAALPLRVKSLRTDEDAVRDGDVPSECCLLIEGFMHRYKVLPDGKRQIPQRDGS